MLRQTVTDLAGAQEVSSVAPLINGAVGRLLGPDTDYQVAIVDCPPASDDAPWPDAVGGGLFETAALPPPIARQVGNRGLTLAIPLIEHPTEPGHADIARNATSTECRRPEAPTTPVTPTPAGSLTGRSFSSAANRSSLNALRPRLEVLATQAAFTLERIRLNKENIRHTSESYFRTLVQNSTDVILIVDDDNRIRYASPSAGSVFGTIALTGVELPGLVAQGDREAAERLLMRARAGVPGTLASESSTPRELETGTRLTSDGMVVADVVRDGDWMVNGDGAGPARVEVSCRDLRADPSIDGLVLTLRNVTKQRLLESELEQRAFHDPVDRARQPPSVQRTIDRGDRALRRERVS